MTGQPLAYLILSRASLMPQSRDGLLRAAGLWFPNPSECVQLWTADLFHLLIRERLLCECAGGLVLTPTGEKRLEREFRKFGPADVPPRRARLSSCLDSRL